MEIVAVNDTLSVINSQEEILEAHETWEISIQSPNRYVGFFRERYIRILKRRSLFLNDSGREAYSDRKKREYYERFAVSNSTE